MRAIETGDDAQPVVHESVSNDKQNEIIGYGYKINNVHLDNAWSANQQLKEKIQLSDNNQCRFVSRVIVQNQGKVYNVRDPECVVAKLGVVTSSKLKFGDLNRYTQDAQGALAGQLETIRNTPFNYYTIQYEKGMKFVEQHYKLYFTALEKERKSPITMEDYSMMRNIKKNLDYQYIDEGGYSVKECSDITEQQLLDEANQIPVQEQQGIIRWFIDANIS